MIAALLLTALNLGLTAVLAAWAIRACRQDTRRVVRDANDLIRATTAAGIPCTVSEDLVRAGVIPPDPIHITLPPGLTFDLDALNRNYRRGR